MVLLLNWEQFFSMQLVPGSPGAHETTDWVSKQAHRLNYLIIQKVYCICLLPVWFAIFLSDCKHKIVNFLPHIACSSWTSLFMFLHCKRVFFLVHVCMRSYCIWLLIYFIHVFLKLCSIELSTDFVPLDRSLRWFVQKEQHYHDGDGECPGNARKSQSTIVAKYAGSRRCAGFFVDPVRQGIWFIKQF